MDSMNGGKIGVVTLDGPAGVGKTTLAKKVAEALHIAYLDTGAMFRTLALRLGDGIKDLPEEEIRRRAADIVFSLKGTGAESQLLCSGVPVGQEIRTEEVGALASRVALIPVVRQILKEAQRSLGAAGSIVVEGRDMGTVVFPQAPYKFFLDASPKVRALRRLNQLKGMGQTASLGDLEKQIRERDDRDRNRPVAPLRPAEDALCIDTSNLTIEDTQRCILGCIRDKQDAQKKAVSAGGVPLLAPYWEAVQEKHPLVHFITNSVIINDCANITLAAGGSPIMADAPEEAGQVTEICNALVLNIGTVCQRTALSMQIAGSAARKLKHMVVLDPVGAGISDIRNNALRMILRDAQPKIIKGNCSEIRYLAEGTGAAKGVDAQAGDMTDEGNLLAHARMAQALAQRQDAVVIITGAIDIVASADAAYAVSNGSPWMGRISGAGCMCAAVLGAYAGASPEDPLVAALAAMAAMGVAGEQAEARLDDKAGAGTYHMYLIDAVSRLDGETLDREKRIRKIL